MSEPTTYSKERYLLAKRTVDDRALNRRVREALLGSLPDRDRLRILEIGVGVGATVPRLVEWGVLAPAVEYRGVDSDPDMIASTREHVPGWLRELGATVADGRAVAGDREDPGGTDAFPADATLSFAFETADALDVLADADGDYDLVIAQAFLDLVDVTPTLEAIEGALAPGGVAYCPITFDGATVFQPTLDPAFDRLIERAYHERLDARPGRDVEAGRHLIARCSGRPGTLVAGASDWIVHPTDGSYPADEAYFLHHVLGFLAEAVPDHPDVDHERFERWLDRRRAAIDAAELVYAAHQYDVLWRPDG